MARVGFIPAASVAVLAAGALLLLRGSEDPYWHDFGMEAWPQYELIFRGEWDAALAGGPAYKVGALLKAPLALLGHGLGGSDQAVFRLIAIPSLIALAWLAVWLGNEARLRLTGAQGAVPATLAIVGASPIAYYAYLYGHPEDVLAAVAAIAAVLAALRGRAVLAGVLLGVAVVNKQWAIVVALPTLLALDRRHVHFCLSAVAVGSLLLVPLLVNPPTGNLAGHVGATSDRFFHPHQLWFPFGVPASADFIAAGHGTTEGPAWLGPIPKPLIVALQLPLALWWLRAGGRTRRREDVLGLVALILLARCALDPWNLVYYHLPLVLALTTWEVVALRRAPWLAIAVTGAVWFSFEIYTERNGYGPFAVYLAWVLPLAAHLVREVLLRPAGERRREAPAGAASLVPARG